MFAKWYFCRLFECKLERGCIHFCRPPTLNLFLCAANLLNKFCVKRSANSRNSQQVSTETPIHKPSWPPISANKLTSYKEHEGKLKSILRPVERKQYRGLVSFLRNQSSNGIPNGKKRSWTLSAQDAFSVINRPTPTGVPFSFSLASQKCTKASARESAARFKVCRNYKRINSLQQLFTVYDDVG